jgi:succinate dehydrogenase/fumarate reductase flavoprotein subunit
VQPNFMLPFDRRGIDPFTDLFEVTLHGEGTIRGVGGIAVTDTDCRTDVPGLFLAGDVASRENIVGAVSGGGAPNSAWAVSSGTWAGRAAVLHARSAPRSGALTTAGQAGLRPAAGKSDVDFDAVIRQVSRELNDYDKNIFRWETGLRTSLSILDDLWRTVRDHATGTDRDAVKARETAALVAVGRWVKESALRRRKRAACIGVPTTRRPTRPGHTASPSAAWTPWGPGTTRWRKRSRDRARAFEALHRM